MVNDVIALTSKLIKKKSISPYDAGCQQLIMSQLVPFDFTLEEMHFGDTHNLWAYHGNASAPTLIFAGHTDVVPPGDETQWHYPPFEPIIDNQGNLYGRGTADMKSSLAAMICAAKEYITQNPTHAGRIGFLITSDEEATGKYGTCKVVQELKRRNERIDFCIVGEPTSKTQLGDQIKNGRRGSLIANLTILGKQGHVAYPHLANNPIHSFAPAFNELLAVKWDNGNDHFPETTMQIVNIHGGTGAENVIPGELKIQFGFRYSSELTDEIIKKRVTEILSKHKLTYQLHWRLSGKPFLTKPGILTQAVSQAVFDVTQINTVLSTSGGTSDGRFITELGCQVVEIGPINSTIHQVNEHIAIKDILLLKQIYKRILEKLISK